MDDNTWYALHIAERYGVDVPQDILRSLVGLEKIREIAARVLPQQQLDQWLADEKAETKRLRKKFNIKPFDKFDDWTETSLR